MNAAADAARGHRIAMQGVPQWTGQDADAAACQRFFVVPSAPGAELSSYRDRLSWSGGAGSPSKRTCSRDGGRTER